MSAQDPADAEAPLPAPHEDLAQLSARLAAMMGIVVATHLRLARDPIAAAETAAFLMMEQAIVLFEGAGKSDVAAALQKLLLDFSPHSICNRKDTHMPIDQGAHFVATADGVIAAIGFGFVCGAICGYGTAMGQLAARHWQRVRREREGVDADRLTPAEAAELILGNQQEGWLP